MRGTYALVIKIESPLRVMIGSLGELSFRKGVWIYVGSAMGNGSTSLENRIARHFRKRKKKQWHIDYLLGSDARILYVVWAESECHMECKFSLMLGQTPQVTLGPLGFGSTDCHAGCRTHLFLYKEQENAEKLLVALMMKLGMKPALSETGYLYPSDQDCSLMDKD